MNRFLLLIASLLLTLLLLAFSFEQQKQFEYNEKYQTIFIPNSKNYYTATFTTKGITYEVEVNDNDIIDIHFLPKGKYIMRIYGPHKNTIRGRINKTVDPKWAF